MSTYRQCMVDVDHPVALFSGVVRGPNSQRARIYEHKAVLYDKIGYGPHLCHWCGEHIAWGPGARQGVVIADHLDGDVENNDPANLVESCNRCNTLRDRLDWRPAIMDGELTVTDRSGARSRAVELQCEECGQVFVAHISRVKRGTVSVCSRRCSGIRGARNRWTKPEVTQ